jgi:ATP-dependent helicase/DNAse subunit B
MERVIGERLLYERRRLPFRVLEQEQGREVTIGPLKIALRSDRVDELEDGRLVILDYKTGEIKTDAWAGERMKEPQVPLYCITSEREVAAAALVQLKTGECKTLGLGAAGILPHLRKMNTSADGEIEHELPAWRAALEDLANRFQDGEATVDPRDRAACDFCKLPGLCRIREMNDAG